MMKPIIDVAPNEMVTRHAIMPVLEIQPYNKEVVAAPEMGVCETIWSFRKDLMLCTCGSYWLSKLAAA